MSEPQARSYPAGVPCWVDLESPDPAAATAFYGGLFGWQFRPAGPYLIATLHGIDVAGIGSGDGLAAWNTYIRVDDVVASAGLADGSGGGTVSGGPVDVGPAGLLALCTDPGGARFRLWQPRARTGAQLANVAGAWNFSHLHTDNEPAARPFYAAVFGWEYDDVPGVGTSIRVPGYGDHLAATIDPGIRERQAALPPGFADVVGGIRAAAGQPHWHVTFSVADRDGAVTTAESLGASISATYESPWAAFADVVDPQGAALTLSQFLGST